MHPDLQPVSFYGLDHINYPKYRNELIDLYTLSFTEGKHAQYISQEVIEASLDNILRIGFGFMAFHKDKMIGAVLCLSLKNDPDFPAEARDKIDLEKTLYITDLMVDHDFRGKGVALGLMEHLFSQSQSKPYVDAVIRVWDQNIPAAFLYKKLNFEEITTISQTKLSKENKEPFEMRKIYLKKKL